MGAPPDEEKSALKKTAAALVAGGMLVGGAFLAPTAQAATAGTTSLPKAGHQTAYVQRGETVTVYRDGRTRATVTVTSAAHPRGRGKLVLTVDAKKPFAFTAGQFIWEDEEGSDNEAANPDRRISVAANTRKTVSIAFDGVGNGDVIYVPDENTVAGAWLVEGKAVDGAAELLPASYLQRGSTVSVYRAGRVVARVTPRSATTRDGKGTLKLDVEAVKSVRVVPAKFIWEDADGGDHRPVTTQAVTVKAGTHQSVTLTYEDVEKGRLVWTPTRDLVAGAWKIG
ncbi:hypothetical protein [Kineosporia succinea]|uniref:Antitoxin (DNA-binding transcriptional repressor) of toxin-antitoxin stability system n=1 Tax=Kineosporia succinea TaxID=84632 RepID=A0ABT9PDH4_9ACTN|nr:hypothetical protein [Kineosporia succinea]MDP9830754.1 antitoxin (DNA-binding transcriptional repressor) of toxin-antitoxin stability system [Kineosporia succinea]